MEGEREGGIVRERSQREGKGNERRRGGGERAGKEVTEVGTHRRWRATQIKGENCEEEMRVGEGWSEVGS